jgi:sulfite reductase (NADPH) hemoprotein beta-component
LPTCPLALAEGQRYMPALISKIEPLLEKYGLAEQDIIMRMTGCPNGCARPYAAEIGFVGTAPGKYNMQLGGDNQGMRLNKTYRENLDEGAILAELDSIFARFTKERNPAETLGDFAMRKNMVPA